MIGYFKNKSGFSLVELSVVMAVIGITLSGALTLATKKTESDKIEETNKKIEMIEEAIDLFVSQYQRLPCPSDASLAENTATFGVEGNASAIDADSNLTIDGVCTLANFNNGLGGNIFAGGVPVRRSAARNEIINLPYDAMFDGWGRRFIYVVDARLANSYATNASCETNNVCFKKTANGSLIIRDASGATTVSNAAYVILSLGKNGNGAFTYHGSATRLADPTDIDERENIPLAGVTTINNIFVDKDSTSSFDDIVSYKTKASIAVGANGWAGVVENNLCESANYQVNNPAEVDSVCYGIADPTICRNFAAKLNSLCFD